MAQQAAWAKQYKKKNVPEAVTVVRRIPTARPPMQGSPYGMAPPPDGSFFPTMSPLAPPVSPQVPPMGPSSGTYTGAGMDGVVQPGKRTGDVHEGEGIIDANAMQAFSPDEFYRMLEMARQGTIDKNMFRASIGLPPVEQLATGGIGGMEAPVDPRSRTRGVPEAGSATPSTITPTIAPPASVPSQPELGTRDRTRGVPQPGTAQPVTPSVPATPTPVTPIQTSTVSRNSVTPTISAMRINPQDVSGDQAPIQTNTISSALREAPPPAPAMSVQAPPQQETIQTNTVTREPLPPTPTMMVNPQDASYKPPATTTPPPQDSTVTPPPATDTTTVTPEATAMSQNASSIVQSGLNELRAMMSGLSETDKKMANYYLTNIDASNAAQLRAAEQQIYSDPELSQAGKNAALAALKVNANAARYDLTGKLAINAAERKDAATINAINAGQSIRNYEDITLPSATISMEAAQENLRQARETYNNYTTPANKLALDQAEEALRQSRGTYDNYTVEAQQVALESARENLRQAQETYNNYTTPANKLALEQAQQALSTALEANTTGNIDNRLGILYASKDLAEIQKDGTLRSLVRQYLGENATEQQITDEIATRWASVNERNKSTFATNIETLIGDAWDNGWTEEKIINDDSIRRNVAGFMGLDVGNTADQQKITDEIKARFEEIKKPEVDRIYDNFIKSGYIDEKTMGIEGFESDMKQTIRDMRMQGVIDETGQLIAGSTFEWPWNAPDTYFKYNDWNGNDTPAASSAQAVISIDGNGTTYKNANGQAVTNADASAAWNNLSSMEKDSYFNSDGTPDISRFLNSYFRTTTGTDGQPVPVTSITDFQTRVLTDEEYALTVSDMTNQWISKSSVPDEMRSNEDSQYFGMDNTIGSINPDSFIYYDEFGRAQSAGKSEGNLAFIWEQLSNKFRKDGQLLTVEQFDEIWKEGKPWRVTKDGTIVNLDSEGKTPGVEQAVDMFKTSVLSSNLTGTISENDAKMISYNYSTIPSELKASGHNFLENTTINKYKTDAGWDRWVVGGAEKDWVKNNTGKLYQAENGRLYVVVGIDDPKSRNSTASIVLFDVVTGQPVYVASSGGNSKQLPLTGASYV